MEKVITFLYNHIICIPLVGGVATHGSIFGMTVVAFYALNDVNCSGNETKIFDCHHLSSSECTAEAGVICGVIPSMCSQSSLSFILTFSFSSKIIQNLSMMMCILI